MDTFFCWESPALKSWHQAIEEAVTQIQVINNRVIELKKP